MLIIEIVRNEKCCVVWWHLVGTEDEMAGWHHRLNGHEFG